MERFITWSESEYGQPFTLAMFNRPDLRDYQAYCRAELKLKSATWNRSVASLSVFAAWLRATGELDYDPTDTLTRADAQKLAPKSLTKPEYKKLRLAVSEQIRNARSITGHQWAIRDAAIVACLWQAGMREGEVVRLRLADLQLGERSGKIEVVNAKGNKDRTIPLGYEAARALRAWLDVRPATQFGNVFIGKFGEALQERGIQKLVAALSEQAGIGHISPHQLRHTAGRMLVVNGSSLADVAAFLGHSSIEVTRRYTLPHYDDLARMAEGLG